MKEVIQNILFPKEEMLKEHYTLYYRGVRGIDYNQNQCVGFPKFTHIGFNTYFNGFSNRKWRKYTDISNVALTLNVQGSFTLKLIGCNLVSGSTDIKVYSENTFHCTSFDEISVAIPDTDDMMIGFEIETLSECLLRSGYYSAEFESDNQTNLALSSTTCHKEKFITRNVRLLYDELLSSNDEVAKHLFIHVVDNGRSLYDNDFPDDHRVFLHPNNNTGGAGGFARGMVECMHQEEGITNVLLMDDDVNMQPESIRKTYYLLKHLKPEFQNNFVSGAMLYMENVQIQKEDIGTVTKDGYFVPLKGRELNQELLFDNLYNEKEFPVDDEHNYAAWWYCCIPMKTIKEKGLPVPVFVRGDDVEYGLRCKPGFITMNGICVWHMGFTGKYNAAMDFYQVNRNLLVDHAISGVMNDVNIIGKATKDFRDSLTRLDYDTAELCLRAIEDYLKGPSYIMEDHGEEILKSNSKLVHKMEPLETFGNPDIGLGDPYCDGKRTFVQKVISRLTRNGHRYWFGAYRKEINSIPYNGVWTPERIYLREKLIAVNPENRTGYILMRNNSKYKILMHRYKMTMKEYKTRDNLIERSYREHKNNIYSEAFWREYLRL